MPASWLVFTDLDATLLDHQTYAADEAAPVLAELSRRTVPVIPVTSKTRAEVLVLRRQLGLEGPYVTENGAGIFAPAALAGTPGARAEPGEVCLGRSKGYEEVRRAFQELARDFRVRGFGDMTVEEIAGHTGLPPESCALARQREFSEPFLLLDAASHAALARRAGERGLRVVKGGRFFHLLDAAAGKGPALRLLRDAYERLWGQRPQTLALGDSPNDLEMLREADRGVVIPGLAGVAAGMDLAGLELAPHPGPPGWAAAVRKVLG